MEDGVVLSQNVVPEKDSKIIGKTKNKEVVNRYERRQFTMAERL